MADVSLFSLLLRLAVSMAVVIGLMLVAARMLRRSASRMGIGGGARGRRERRTTIDVEAMQHLTKTAHVAVVSAAGRELVLGVTEHQVTLLHSSPMDDPAEDDLSSTAFELGSQDSASTTSSSARIAIEDPANAESADTAGLPAWMDALELLRDRTVRR